MKTRTDTLPYWSDSASAPVFPKLDRDLDVDVLIIGGGITGLSAAYFLTAAGKEVALIERDRLAAIDTGHTSAHLTMVTDSRFTELAQSFGVEGAKAAWHAGLSAIATIHDIVRAESIDCDFAWVPGYLHVPLGSGPESRREADQLRAEAAAIAEAGFDAAFVDDVPLVGRPGVRFANQARIHPRQYLAAVARVVSDRGGLIFEHTAAGEFASGPAAVHANGHRIRCERIIIATHAPLMGNTNVVSATAFQTKLALYTSYVVAGRVPKGRLPDALWWDTASPYHYVRVEPHRDFDVVILGGEDHKTGQADDTRDRFAHLEQTLRLMAGDVSLTHHWSGQVIETYDGLPYIGEATDGQFAGTGYSGNGLTFGTLAGMMAADYVRGSANPWRELFEPGRVSVLGGAWKYVIENADFPYYLIRDRVAGKNTPVCTHMGCLLDWNNAEGTWDCPCHGSRFKKDGSVISGPAGAPIDVK